MGKFPSPKVKNLQSCPALELPSIRILSLPAAVACRCNYFVIINSMKPINPPQIVYLSTMRVTCSFRQDSCHTSSLLSLCLSVEIQYCCQFHRYFNVLVTSQRLGGSLAWRDSTLKGAVRCSLLRLWGNLFPSAFSPSSPSFLLLHPSFFLEAESLGPMFESWLCLLTVGRWPRLPQPLFPHL